MDPFKKFALLSINFMSHIIKKVLLFFKNQEQTLDGTIAFRLNSSYLI